MKDKKYYAGLNYPVILTHFFDDGELVYKAEIKELPGLKVYGDTEIEVLEDIEVAKEEWIEFNLELNRPIPEPLELDDLSGRVTLRMAKSTHKEVKELADREGIPLNPMLNQLIQKGMQYSYVDRAFEEVKDQYSEIVRQLNIMKFDIDKKFDYHFYEETKQWKTKETFISSGFLSLI